MKNDSGIRISFNEEARNDAKIKVIGVGGGNGDTLPPPTWKIWPLMFQASSEHR